MGKDNKKEKKHSNAKTAFIVLGGTVLLIVIAIIATGGWNPFKSNEVSKEAKVAYEESFQVPKDIGTEVLMKDLKNQGYDNFNELSDTYKENGKYPYGFEIKDYGLEGQDGVLKEMISVLDQEYRDSYGANLFIYYLKNKDYAKEKYLAMRGSYLGSYYKEFDIKNGKVAFAQSSDYQGGFVLVREGSVVYYGLCNDNKEFNRLQKWFDVIGVDFKFTSVDEIFGK